MECHQLVKHPGHLLLCLAAVWILVASAADVAPASRRPDCKRRCGDINIPYPFGLDADCAIHPDFQLNCTTVNGSLKLFVGGLEVSKISIPDGKIWVNKMGLSSQCYEPETNTTSYKDNNSGLIFNTQTYWLSHDDNKIVVIGCNALAYLRSSHFVIGCSSTCNNTVAKNNTCNGAGCCQADVPKGIQTYRGYFNENYNTTDIWTTSRCNYMAVMEAASFNFSTTYLNSTEFWDTYHRKVPVVLDWIIWNTTCEAAKKNTTSYACVSSHSDCVDATNNQQGYRCKCSSGFEGNPYITDGCKDIDECNAIVPRPCPEICTNTLGNYTCTCQEGKHLIDGTCQHGSSSRWIMPVIGVETEVPEGNDFDGLDYFPEQEFANLRRTSRILNVKMKLLPMKI